MCAVKILNAALDAYQVGATLQILRLSEYDNNHTMLTTNGKQQMLQSDLRICQVVELAAAAKLVVTVHNADSVKVQQELTHEQHGDISLR